MRTSKFNKIIKESVRKSLNEISWQKTFSAGQEAASRSDETDVWRDTNEIRIMSDIRSLKNDLEDYFKLFLPYSTGFDRKTGKYIDTRYFYNTQCGKLLSKCISCLNDMEEDILKFIKRKHKQYYNLEIAGDEVVKNKFGKKPYEYYDELKAKNFDNLTPDQEEFLDLYR